MKAHLLRITAVLLLTLSCLKLSAQTPYVGGSLQAAYTTYFDFRPHFLGGYEFNDKWAIGGGVGLDYRPLLITLMPLVSWRPM